MAAARYDVDVGTRPTRERPEIRVPGERVRLPQRTVLASYVLAVVLPVVTGLLLIPLRAEHPETVAVVLVLPVVLVAIRGATAPAVMAALVAGAAYAVLLTEPYGQVAVDETDDIVTALTLVVVAGLVGWLSSRLVHLDARATARGAEVEHLVEFWTVVAGEPGPGALEAAAGEHIAGVLGAASAAWTPGAAGGDGPVLHPDGTISGYVTDLHPDRSQLPERVVLPVVADGHELGHFVIAATVGRLTSFEERRTAATIAQILGRELR